MPNEVRQRPAEGRAQSGAPILTFQNAPIPARPLHALIGSPPAPAPIAPPEQVTAAVPPTPEKVIRCVQERRLFPLCEKELLQHGAYDRRDQIMALTFQRAIATIRQGISQ